MSSEIIMNPRSEAEGQRGLNFGNWVLNRQDAKTAKEKPEKPILTTKDTNHTKWETGKPI